MTAKSFTRMGSMAAGMNSLKKDQGASLMRSMRVASIVEDDVDPETEMATWFAGGSTRDEIVGMTSDLETKGGLGNFFVHDGEGTTPNEPYGMCVKTSEDTIMHFALRRKLEEYVLVLQGADQDASTQDGFETIAALVEFYSKSVQPPIPMKLNSEAEFQGVFAGALGRRKTSRRGKGASVKVASKATLLGTVVEDIDAVAMQSFWFLSGVERGKVRECVFQLMEAGTPGNFLVRDKQNVAAAEGQPSPDKAFALNVKQSDTEMLCYLIEQVTNKWSIRGTDERFSSLSILISYYLTAPRGSIGIQLNLDHQGMLTATLANNQPAQQRRPSWVNVSVDTRAGNRQSSQRRGSAADLYNLAALEGAMYSTADETGVAVGSAEATYAMADDQMYSMATDVYTSQAVDQPGHEGNDGGVEQTYELASQVGAGPGPTGDDGNDDGETYDMASNVGAGPGPADGGADGGSGAGEADPTYGLATEDGGEAAEAAAKPSGPYLNRFEQLKAEQAQFS